MRAHKPENRLKTFCFCFLRRGPGPSEVAGGLTLTERSKTLRLGDRKTAAITGLGLSEVPLVRITEREEVLNENS